MRSVKVDIEGQSYDFGYGLRSLFLFEQISGKPFALERMSDTYMFYFCCFMACDADFMGGDFKKFIDACDADPLLGRRMADALNELTKAEKAMDGRDEPSDDKKKV